MAGVENTVVTKFTADIADLKKGLADLQQGMTGVQKNTAQATGGFTVFKGAMSTAFGVAAIGGIYKMTGALKELVAGSFDAAARVQELEIVTDAVGKATGVGGAAIRATTNDIRAQGIELAASQQIALEFARNQLNMADAAKISRTAQDLAVISQRNSTETAQLLTRAVITGRTELLKSAGISEQAGVGMQRYAASLGKNVDQLTAVERQQAIVNLILEEGTKVAGVYEASMQSPGKVLRSFARIINDIQIEIGSLLTSAFGPLILETYNLLKAFSLTLREGGALRPVLDTIGSALKNVVEPITNVVRNMANFVKGMKEADTANKNLSGFAMIIMQLRDLGTTFVEVAQHAGKTLGPPLQKLGQVFNNTLGPIITRTISILIAMVKTIASNLQPVFTALGQAIEEYIQPAFQKLIEATRRFMPAFQAVAGAIANVVGFLARHLLPILVTVAAFIVGKAIEAFSMFLDVLTFVASNGAKAITFIANKVIDFINVIIKGINAFNEFTNVETRFEELEHVTNSLDFSFQGAAKSTTEFRDESEKAGIASKGLKRDVEGVNEVVTDTGAKTKKTNDALKAMRDRFNELSREANKARESLLAMTRSVYGELTDLQESFDPEGLDIKKVVQNTDELMSLAEKIMAPIKFMGGAVGNLATQVQAQFTRVVTAARDNFVRLLKEREEVDAALERNEKDYRERVKNINKTFDALDKEAAQRVKNLSSYYDNLIKGLRTQLDGASKAFQEADNKLKELVSKRQQALDGIAKGFRGFLNSLSFKRAAEIAGKGVKDTGKVIETTVKDLGNGIRITIQRELQPAMEQLSEMGTDVPITAAEIRSQLQERLDAIREFATNIRTLVSRGLDATLVEEFVTAGVSGAGDVVASLAGASQEELAAINAIQSQLTAQVSDFTAYASEQWYNSSIAQQEAVVAPLKASYEEAQTAFNNAEVLREAELLAAQEQVNLLREQRQTAIAAADADYEAQRIALEDKRKSIDASIREQATMLQEAMKNFGTQTVTMMEWAGNESRKKFKEGFNKKFPDMSARLNQMMTNLAESMRRETSITVTTVHRTVYESASLPGRAIGGPVVANRAYVVGERGPELFMPNLAGQILPAGETRRALSGMRPNVGPTFMGGGSNGNSYQINVNVPVTANSAEVGRQVVDAITAFERRNGRVYEPA